MKNTGAIFADGGIQAAVILSDVNKFYFTDFISHNSSLLLMPDKAWLFVDKRYSEEAREKLPALGIEVIETLDKTTIEPLSGFIRAKGIKSLGFEDGRIPFNQYEILSGLGAELFKAGALIDGLRKVKDGEEIKRIKKAADITEKSYLFVLDLIKEGVTEKEIADELIYRMRKNGAEDIAFDPIVAFGANTSKPHHLYGNKKLKNNDVITIDMGAKYNGYCSDMTRSFVFGNKIDAEYKKIHAAVSDAQKAALDFLKAGVSGIAADAAARDLLESRGYGDYFTHSCGHSVGIEIHENPGLTKKSEEAFKAGNIVTVEPGVYIEKKFGVRIEDMVLVTDNGVKNFYSCDKNINI